MRLELTGRHVDITPALRKLVEGKLAKLERICQKLKLTPDDHVLEIGTGWGGFALYAAERYGCRVTTTTISAEQHAYARERIAAAGLHDRVTVLFEEMTKVSPSCSFSPSQSISSSTR